MLSRPLPLPERGFPGMCGNPAHVVKAHTGHVWGRCGCFPLRGALRRSGSPNDCAVVWQTPVFRLNFFWFYPLGGVYRFVWHSKLAWQCRRQCACASRQRVHEDALRSLEPTRSGENRIFGDFLVGGEAAAAAPEYTREGNGRKGLERISTCLSLRS